MIQFLTVAHRSRGVGIVMGIVLAAGVFSKNAFAYIPPSAFLVKSFASKHVAARALRVRSTVSGIDSSASTTVNFKKTTIYLPASHVVRFWINDETGALVYGAQIPVLQGSPLLALLFESRADMVSERLKQFGIPIKTEAELLRLETEDDRRRVEVQKLDRYRAPGSTTPTIAWSIGKDLGQLWVAKDTLLPLRLIADRRASSSAGGSDAVVEYVMTGARYARDFTMPKQIEYFRSGEKIAFREDIIDVTQDASAAEISFAIPDGFAAGSNLSSSVRGLIQSHVEALR